MRKWSMPRKRESSSRRWTTPLPSWGTRTTTSARSAAFRWSWESRMPPAGAVLWRLRVRSTSWMWPAWLCRWAPAPTRWSSPPRRVWRLTRRAASWSTRMVWPPVRASMPAETPSPAPPPSSWPWAPERLRPRPSTRRSAERNSAQRREAKRFRNKQ